MPTDLTLPCDIPGLLRRGSPVRIQRDGQRKTRAVVGQLYPPTLVGVYEHGEPKRTGRATMGEASLVGHVFLELDLTDATGRAHAAWWLIGRCTPVIQWFDLHNAIPLWAQPGWNDEDRGVFWRNLRMTTILNGELDCLNLRTLPDESRWVDAEALRRVVLHVAGRSDDAAEHA